MVTQSSQFRFRGNRHPTGGVDGTDGAATVAADQHAKECPSMALSDNVRDSARDELRALRDQVNALMEDRVAPAYEQASRRASEAAHRARVYTEDKAGQVSDRVRDQPLIAIGVAAAVGFLFGRITK